MKEQIKDKERNIYLFGTVIFAILFICTILFGNFVSPLTLLYVRLSMVGTALVFNISIFVYCRRSELTCIESVIHEQQVQVSPNLVPDNVELRLEDIQMDIIETPVPKTKVYCSQNDGVSIWFNGRALSKN